MEPLLPLLLTPGAVRGVGPEVALAALRARPGAALLVGEIEVLRGLEPGICVVEDLQGLKNHPERVALSPAAFWNGSEPIEAAAIRFAARMCMEGKARGLVTGPIHKARLKAQGFRWSGHTDFLGHLCGVGESGAVMAFTAPQLSTQERTGEKIPVCVSLATVHLPLRQVADALTRAGLTHTLNQTIRGCQALGIPGPVVYVCGLNPHAGEDGYLGREEIEVIGPVCQKFRDQGWNIVGPISAETAFIEARRQTPAAPIHGIVAMYHDQALVPLKALGFGQCVNWTLGLPMVRTSVDHGTADALVGTGRASPDSMIAALDLAIRLTRP